MPLTLLPSGGRYDSSSSDGVYVDAYMRVDREGLPVPPAARATASRYIIPEDAVLGPIAAADLDLAAVSRLSRSALPPGVDGKTFRQALASLNDPVALAEHVLLPPGGVAGEIPRQRRPVSVVPPAVFRQLEPIVAVCPQGVGPNTPIARLYLVEKRRSGPGLTLWRVILACLTANAVCRAPPRAPVPYLRTLIRRLMDSTVAYRCDFRSWFFQFAVSAAVSVVLFAWLMRRGRGDVPLQMMLTRLPMGWTWAVYIATTTALVLLRAGTVEGLGRDCTPEVVDATDVWVDDGVLFDTDERRLVKRWKGVQEVLRRTRAELKEFEGPVRRFDMVGLRFDLTRSRWCLAPVWVERFRERVTKVGHTAARPSLRSYWRLVGCAVWCLYALYLPYAVAEPLFDVLRSVLPTDKRRPTASVLAAPVRLTAAARKAVVAIAAVAHEWRRLAASPSCVLPLATDASAIGGGVVFTCLASGTPWETGTADGVPSRLTFRDQQRLELRAAVGSVRRLAAGGFVTVPAPPRGTELVLLVDNLGLCYRMSGWQTAGTESEDVMLLWNELATRGWTLRVGWIRTALMPADGPSRSVVVVSAHRACAFGELIANAVFPTKDVAPSSLVVGGP